MYKAETKVAHFAETLGDPPLAQRDSMLKRRQIMLRNRLANRQIVLFPMKAVICLHRVHCAGLAQPFEGIEPMKALAGVRRGAQEQKTSGASEHAAFRHVARNM